MREQEALAEEMKWHIFQILCEMQRGLDLFLPDYKKEREKSENKVNAEVLTWFLAICTKCCHIIAIRFLVNCANMLPHYFNWSSSQPQKTAATLLSLVFYD